VRCQWTAVDPEGCAWQGVCRRQKSPPPGSHYLLCEMEPEPELEASGAPTAAEAGVAAAACAGPAGPEPEPELPLLEPEPEEGAPEHEHEPAPAPQGRAAPREAAFGAVILAVDPQMAVPFVSPSNLALSALKNHTFRRENAVTDSRLQCNSCGNCVCAVLVYFGLMSILYMQHEGAKSLAAVLFVTVVVIYHKKFKQKQIQDFAAIELTFQLADAGVGTAKRTLRVRSSSSATGDKDVLGTLAAGEQLRVIGHNVPDGVHFDEGSNLVAAMNAFPRDWPGPRVEIELPQSMAPAAALTAPSESEGTFDLEESLSRSTAGVSLANSGWVVVNIKKARIDKHRGLTPENTRLGECASA
jgi:hypothetical protein